MGRPWLFDLGALIYGIMTAQPIWQASCAHLAGYFPIERHANGRPRVLDLGCGPGVSTIILAQSRPEAVVVGLDLAPRMLDQAKQYTRRAHVEHLTSYVLADGLQLPFADASVDMITGHSFLYLVPDRRKVLAEAFRVLRAGGRMAFMEPHAHARLSALARHWRQVRYIISVLLWRPYSYWHGQLSIESFTALLAGSGLHDIRMELVQDGFGIIGSGEKP